MTICNDDNISLMLKLAWNMPQYHNAVCFFIPSKWWPFRCIVIQLLPHKAKLFAICRPIHWWPNWLLDTSWVQWTVDQICGSVLLGEKYVLCTYDKEHSRPPWANRIGDWLLPVDTDYPCFPGVALCDPWSVVEGIDWCLLLSIIVGYFKICFFDLQRDLFFIWQIC